MNADLALKQLGFLQDELAKELIVLINKTDTTWDSFVLSVKWDAQSYELVIESLHDEEPKYHYPTPHIHELLTEVWRINCMFAQPWNEILVSVKPDYSVNVQYAYPES